MIKKIISAVKNNEKNKEIFSNSFFSMLIKGLGFIISFVSMPLYISYFDNQTILGIWFTIISMLTWIFTFDLGLGNGLRNMLVSTFVNKDYKKAKIYISSAYAIIIILVLIIGVIGVTLIQTIDWNNILNIQKEIVSNNTFKLCINILFVGILVSFILKILNSILYAMQKSAVNNALSFCTSVIPVIYLWLANPSTIENNLIKLSIVNVLANCLPLLIATIYVFSKPLKNCIPQIKYVSKKIGMSIVKFGSLFFVVQITFMLITSTNEIIITNLFEPEQVVEYQIYYKIFTAIGSIFSLLLSPIWSAVTKAIAQKDYQWVVKLNKILYKLSILASGCEFLMIPFLQFFINIWLKESAIQVNYVYAIVFALFGSVFILNIVSTTIANGVGKLKTQLYCYSIGVILKLPIVLFLKLFFNSWITTVIANIIILLVFCIIQNININKYINSQISSNKLNE